MLAVARVDYSRFRELRVGIYSAMVFSICLVFVFAEATRGSHRWIELPFFTFQPSELGKVLLILVLAAVVIDRSHGDSSWRKTGRVLLLGAIPAALVFLQPDLGILIGVRGRDARRAVHRRHAVAAHRVPSARWLRPP